LFFAKMKQITLQIGRSSVRYSVRIMVCLREAHAVRQPQARVAYSTELLKLAVLFLFSPFNYQGRRPMRENF